VIPSLPSEPWEEVESRGLAILPEGLRSESTRWLSFVIVIATWPLLASAVS